MNLVLTCILLYVLLQLVFAFWFSAARRVRSEADYLLAGRSLGPWLGTFAVFATWFGAETCIGAAGEAYRLGLSGVIAEPLGYGLGVVLMGAFFAVGLWKRGLVTLADLFRGRYGLGVERLTALVMIPSSVMWAAAQVRALGQVLASASELGLLLAITLAAAVVILYTAVGGMWADAVTDLVQGLVLIAGIVGLFVVFWSIGGAEALAQLPTERLDPLHDHHWLEALDMLAVPVLSTIAAQELASRVLAMRGARLARRATVGAGLLYFGVGLIPVTLGLGAAAFVGADVDPEQMLPRFAQHYLPTPLYILFLCALVSAILSTLSGALLVAGSLAAHNLLTPWNPHWTERRKLQANRTTVVLFGLVAYGLAVGSDSVYELVRASSSFGTAGILVLLVFGLWTPRLGSACSAYAAIIVGTLAYVLFERAFEWRSPYLGAVAASFAAYLLAAPFGRTPPPASVST